MLHLFIYLFIIFLIYIHIYIIYIYNHGKFTRYIRKERIFFAGYRDLSYYDSLFFFLVSSCAIFLWHPLPFVFLFNRIVGLQWIYQLSKCLSFCVIVMYDETSSFIPITNVLWFIRNLAPHVEEVSLRKKEKNHFQNLIHPLNLPDFLFLTYVVLFVFIINHRNCKL